MAWGADDGAAGREIQLLANIGSSIGEKRMSVTAQAHGMDGTLVAPDWPPLRRDEIRTVLRQFPALNGPVQIVSCSPRPLSAAGTVATRAGRIFIKRHHRSVRNREGLLEEHRFVAHLAGAGGQVPRVFASGSGESAIELGEWTYEVHETPPGIDLYEEAISWTPFHGPAHARAAGEALARLHVASAGFEAPRRRPRPLVASFSIFAAADAAAELDRYLSARPSLADHAAVKACAFDTLDLLERFHRELMPLLPELVPLWTHNDLHCSNLFWSDASGKASATAVIDFGLSDLTNAVHDIAHAIERNIVEWLVLVQDPAHPERVPIHFDHLEALLAGYESVRPLTDAEAAALAPMAALCHAEFALSESDYFLGVLHSEERARMAYDGWLLGHARWFGGAGARLVDALRDWAAHRIRS